MEKTSEEILNEVVFAVACVARHYGSGLSETGLQDLRKLLNGFIKWTTDTCYRCDVYEEDEYVDFHERIIVPKDWDDLNFQEIVEESKI